MADQPLESKPRTKRKAHDLSQADLDHALERAERPEILSELVATSRRHFGQHVPHYPHTVNYPWVAAHLENIPVGSRFLEIGAGANPLPLYFAAKGMAVDTVDNADFTRTLPADETWNEWGYFDYGALDRRIRSFNISVTGFEPETAYDAIYSVSVIAHMPTPVREATLDRCAAWLKPGGKLLLAIDLIPETDTLWNLGGSNETAEGHGTYGDVENHLRRLGLHIAESRVVRQVWKSRTDLYFLIAQR